MSGTHQDCQSAWTKRPASSIFGSIFTPPVIETSWWRKGFPQRSPCPPSHKCHLKSDAEPLVHVSVTQAGPCSGPRPSNNIHCFLPLKKEHPLRSILDVGGQIFGLKTRGSRLITTVPPVFFPRVQKKRSWVIRNNWPYCYLFIKQICGLWENCLSQWFQAGGHTNKCM